MVATKKEDGGAGKCCFLVPPAIHCYALLWRSYLIPGPDKNTGGGSGGEGDQSGIVKANKGMILRKSVEYIR